MVWTWFLEFNKHFYPEEDESESESEDSESEDSESEEERGQIRVEHTRNPIFNKKSMDEVVNIIISFADMCNYHVKVYASHDISAIEMNRPNPKIQSDLTRNEIITTEDEESLIQSKIAYNYFIAVSTEFQDYLSRGLEEGDNGFRSQEECTEICLNLEKALSFIKDEDWSVFRLDKNSAYDIFEDLCGEVFFEKDKELYEDVKVVAAKHKKTKKRKQPN